VNRVQTGSRLLIRSAGGNRGKCYPLGTRASSIPPIRKDNVGLNEDS